MYTCSAPVTAALGNPSSAFQAWTHSRSACPELAPLLSTASDLQSPLMVSLAPCPMPQVQPSEAQYCRQSAAART